VVIRFKKDERDGLVTCERKVQIYRGLVHTHKNGQKLEALGVNEDNINMDF
jgi:hypothetical protein